MIITTADGHRLDAVRRGSGPPVVLAHGITADLDENGLCVELADALTAAGFAVLRFSFRGHGASTGAPRETTVAGERLDLRAAVAAAGPPGVPVRIVASSFGAVATTLTAADLPVAGLVLWQPVLDLRATFLDPELPRGRALYADRAGLLEHGHLDIEGRFQLGAALFAEFARLDPRAAFVASTTPALVLHGDADEHVSHDIARAAAAQRPHTEFRSVPGAGHGFRGHERHVVAATADWLARRSA